VQGGCVRCRVCAVVLLTCPVVRRVQKVVRSSAMHTTFVVAARTFEFLTWRLGCMSSKRQKRVSKCREEL
jgi:hypothetical protein